MKDVARLKSITMLLARNSYSCAGLESTSNADACTAGSTALNSELFCRTILSVVVFIC